MNKKNDREAKKAEKEAKKKEKQEAKNKEVEEQLEALKQLSSSTDHFVVISEILKCSPWRTTDEAVKKSITGVFHKRLLDAKMENVEKIITQLNNDQCAIFYLFLLKCLELIKQGNKTRTTGRLSGPRNIFILWFVETVDI